MTTVRNPAVAGMFYPANPAELKATINGYLGAAKTSGPVPKAIIAPHAGFVYSGSVAASAYARIAPARDTITRVILLGPAHRVAVAGLALPSADSLATPLGNIPVDKKAAAMIADLPQVKVMDAAHESEHSLEVHLPFLQRVLQRFKIVPILMYDFSDANCKMLSQALSSCLNGKNALLVASTDLCHYPSYEEAKKTDSVVVSAISKFDP